MVSLLKLAKITEEGVRFLSPHDGTPMYVETDIVFTYLVISSFDFALICSCRRERAPFFQASHPRTFHGFTEFYRLGYHDAAG